MSTRLWLSLRRSTAVAVTLLALAGVAHAADIPASACVELKLKAAGWACGYVFGSVYNNGELDEDGITRAAEFLAIWWSNAANYTDCGQSAPTSDAVVSDMTSAASSIVSSIWAGVDPNNRLEQKCRGLFVGYAGSSCDMLLGVDRLGAKGLGQKKLDARRRRVMKQVNKRLTGSFNAVCPPLPNADAITAAILALENAVVTDILTPAP